MANDFIDVEVAYALPERQWLIALELKPGATARDAVVAAIESGALPALDLERHKLGIFSRPVAPEHKLSGGDRVEIYRPLEADPKEVRRALAAAGKTMGRHKG